MRCISYIYYYIFHDGVGVLCYLMRLQPRIIPLKNLLTIQDLYHRLQCYINLSTLSVHLSFGGLYLHTVPVQCTSIIWRALAIYIHLLYTVHVRYNSHWRTLSVYIYMYLSFGVEYLYLSLIWRANYLCSFLIWRDLSEYNSHLEEFIRII